MHHPPHVRGSQQVARDEWEFLFFFFTFVAGFAVTLVAWLWLFIRYGWEEMAWWEIPPTLLEVVMASLTGGIMLTLVVLKVYVWWRRWMGTFQSPCCHRSGHTPGICDRCTGYRG